MESLNYIWFFSGKVLLSSGNPINPIKAIRDIQWHDENTTIFVTHSGHLQLFDIRGSEMVFIIHSLHK